MTASPDRIKELARMAKASVTARRKAANGKPLNALPLAARDDRILAQRLAFALRHPVSADAVLIDIAAAELLLHRLGSAAGEENEDLDT